MKAIAFYLSHTIQFPSCSDAEAISVACLDLHYSVTLHEHVQGREQEKKEVYTPICLNQLEGERDPQVQDNGSTYTLDDVGKCMSSF